MSKNSKTGAQAPGMDVQALVGAFLLVGLVFWNLFDAIASVPGMQ